MARVNVETRAIAENRFGDFAGELEMSRAEAIGTLVLFWHDSQERGVWKAPKETLLKFIPFAKSEREQIFAAMLENDYIESCSDGEYVIRGNRKHVEAIEEKKRSGSAGGFESGKVRSGQKSNKIKHNEALASTIEAPASSAEPNTIQYNAIQSSAVQCNSKQRNTRQLRKRTSWFDLESAYRRYPRKEGKSKGIEKLAKEIQTPADFEKLIVAVENYASSRRGQDPQFTKHFSTFASEWRDWIEYNPSASPPSTPNNPAYRRMAGNQHALNEALKAIGEDGDEQAS